MKKIRTVGLGIVLATGLAMFGTGIAHANVTAPAVVVIADGDGADAGDGGAVEEPSTGSADGLAALLEALVTGSAGADDATDQPDVPVDTTSATLIGDGDADAGDGGAVEEPSTGSADGLAALLEALVTGSAGADDATDQPDVPVDTTSATLIGDGDDADAGDGGAVEEPSTGSADGLAAALEALVTGSAGAEDPATETPDA
ncbi:hypothetical protein [Nocardia sp. SSK8]|uniref:hypothetical protein n=1 Tax=Nocardia sp. SSK8 TaxID=3120154 RepID=UPI0030098C94